MAAAQSMRVALRISAEDYKRYYQGSVHNVIARSRDGRSIQFPANILRPFLMHDGISGEFEIFFDRDNKFQGIKKIM